MHKLNGGHFTLNLLHLFPFFLRKLSEKNGSPPWIYKPLREASLKDITPPSTGDPAVDALNTVEVFSVLDSDLTNQLVGSDANAPTAMNLPGLDLNLRAGAARIALENQEFAKQLPAELRARLLDPEDHLELLQVPDPKNPQQSGWMISSSKATENLDTPLVVEVHGELPSNPADIDKLLAKTSKSDPEKVFFFPTPSVARDKSIQNAIIGIRAANPDRPVAAVAINGRPSDRLAVMNAQQRFDAAARRPRSQRQSRPPQPSQPRRTPPRGGPRQPVKSRQRVA